MLSLATLPLLEPFSCAGFLQGICSGEFRDPHVQSGWEKGRSPQGHFFGAAPRVPCSQTAFRTNGFGFSCIQGINPKADFVVA